MIEPGSPVQGKDVDLYTKDAMTSYLVEIIVLVTVVTCENFTCL